MPVERDDAAGVLDLDAVAVTTPPAGEENAPITGCMYRRPDRSGVVDALVGADEVEDRVVARRVEARAHARELHRCPQEGLVEAAPVRGVVARVSFGVAVAHGPKLAPLVHELGGLDGSIPQIRPI